MKKYILIFGLVIFSYQSFSQLCYKNELPAIDGVEIKYRFFRAKFFDKNSPLSLRFKFENTNDYDVKVKFELIYYLNIMDIYESGMIEVCIPENKTRKGRRHGLYFETIVKDVEEFEKEDNWWELENFSVEKNEEDC